MMAPNSYGHSSFDFDMRTSTSCERHVKEEHRYQWSRCKVYWLLWYNRPTGSGAERGYTVGDHLTICDRGPLFTIPAPSTYFRCSLTLIALCEKGAMHTALLVDSQRRKGVVSVDTPSETWEPLSCGKS